MCLTRIYRKWRFKDTTTQGKIDNIKNKYYQRIIKENEESRRQKEKKILERYNNRGRQIYDMRYSPLDTGIGYSTSYIR